MAFTFDNTSSDWAKRECREHDPACGQCSCPPEYRVARTFKLAAQSDRTKQPKLTEYRPMTLEEAKNLTAGSHPSVILNSGRVGVVKVNGAVRRWKREPDRIEVPAKYGMYEYTTFYNRADGTVQTSNGNMLVVAV